MKELVNKHKVALIVLVVGWVVLIALGIPWMMLDPQQWYFFAGVTATLGVFYTAIVGGVTAVTVAIKGKS